MDWGLDCHHICMNKLDNDNCLCYIYFTHSHVFKDVKFLKILRIFIALLVIFINLGDYDFHLENISFSSYIRLLI